MSCRARNTRRNARNVLNVANSTRVSRFLRISNHHWHRHGQATADAERLPHFPSFSLNMKSASFSPEQSLYHCLYGRDHHPSDGDAHGFFFDRNQSNFESLIPLQTGREWAHLSECTSYVYFERIRDTASVLHSHF